MVVSPSSSKPLAAAQLLADARIVRRRLTVLPEAVRPQTPEQAYACQDELIAQYLDHYGGTLIGYKIACTNVTAQQQLSVDGPFRGRLLSRFCFDSPAHLVYNGRIGKGGHPQSAEHA